MNALPVCDDRYIKTKIKTDDDKAFFYGLHVTEDGLEYESFTIVPIDFLLVYGDKYYLQVYLDNCAYKTVDTQMIHYLDDNLFESREN